MSLTFRKSVEIDKAFHTAGKSTFKLEAFLNSPDRPKNDVSQCFWLSKYSCCIPKYKKILHMSAKDAEFTNSLQDTTWTFKTSTNFINLFLVLPYAF